MQMRIPKIEQLKELRSLPRTRIQIESLGNRRGNSEFGSGGPAGAGRRESIADRLQRSLLAWS